MGKSMQDAAALAALLRQMAAAETVAPAALAALVTDVFTHCGVPQQDAEVGAEVALWAQTHGSDSHGVVHLPLYTRGLLDGTIKSNPAITTAPTAALLHDDGRRSCARPCGEPARD
jgi:LDH2 family malate/lactate/ureidoglycolate dehydrogenase